MVQYRLGSKREPGLIGQILYTFHNIIYLPHQESRFVTECEAYLKM